MSHSAPSTTSSSGQRALVVRAMEALEGASFLDPLVNAVEPLAQALVRSPKRRDLLQGKAIGHGVHPLLTDLPLGMWTSTNVLDLFAGEQARDASTRLLGIGIVAAVPTAVTGWAEWAPIHRPEKRVGVVHAVMNVTALSLYTASYLARKRGNHARGVSLALAGSAVVAGGGYLGGHLVEARKVSTRHPDFDDDSPTQGTARHAAGAGVASNGDAPHRPTPSSLI